MEITSAEFGVKVGVDKLTAAGLMKGLVAMKLVTKVGTRPAAGGKGKPSTVFEVPSEVVVKVG